MSGNMGEFVGYASKGLGWLVVYFVGFGRWMPSNYDGVEAGVSRRSVLVRSKTNLPIFGSLISR